GWLNPMALTANNGWNPNARQNTQYAIVVEMNAGISASASKSGSRYNTSTAKIAPANGAWKIAPIPAPRPAAISTRRSESGSFSFVARNDPNPAPICAIGPSRPPDPPVPSVIAEDTI